MIIGRCTGGSVSPARHSGDDAEATATTGTDGRIKAQSLTERCNDFAIVSFGDVLFLWQHWSDQRESGAATSIGEEAIVTDAMKAIG